MLQGFKQEFFVGRQFGDYGSYSGRQTFFQVAKTSQID